MFILALGRKCKGNIECKHEEFCHNKLEKCVSIIPQDELVIGDSCSNEKFD